MSDSETQDANRGPVVVAILWTETAVATLIVAMRFYARKLIRRVSWDDWLMLITLVLFIACAALTTAQSNVGGYRHAQFLSTDDVLYALEMNFFLRAVNILSFASGKAAIGALILRIMGPHNQWQRWVVWAVIVLTAIINVLNCIFNFIQCHPIKANWNPEVPHNCWAARTQLDFAYFMSSENIAADVILAVIPATLFWQLRVSLSRRIYLSILLGLGSMATICGITKTTELDSISDQDFTWGEYGLTLWSLSETFVIIFTGCLPTLKPAWDRITGSKVKTSSNEHSETESTRHLSYVNGGTDFSHRQGYQLFSFASKAGDSSSSPFCDGIHGHGSKNEIRATTQIDVSSHSV